MLSTVYILQGSEIKSCTNLMSLEIESIESNELNIVISSVNF